MAFDGLRNTICALSCRGAGTVWSGVALKNGGGDAQAPSRRKEKAVSSRRVFMAAMIT
jgi:hypothetical protein